ncbi:MAG: helix-turn-helix domain-containing protein [Syntrophobacteraceae bacterium]
MGITLKQASKALRLAESEVMDLVAAGKLKAEQKGKRLIIDESELEALLPPEHLEQKSSVAARPRQVSLPEMLVRPLTERISALEKEVSEQIGLISENRRLIEELRHKDREIAARDTEIERLKCDLVYQKRLLEKEIEDRMRVLDEKRVSMDRELSSRVGRERDEFVTRLEAERMLWSERLAREQEKCAAEVAELQTKQGFWTRLARMLTWS